jgi:hypothetical protein
MSSQRSGEQIRDPFRLHLHPRKTVSACHDTIEDEQGTTRVRRTGRIGCTVAISVLALVKFDDMETVR